jgi:four helix bundle protein
MSTVKTHRDLVVWQEAMNLVELVYRRTQEFPTQEVFGLSAQMRRAAISIPSNIAEGAGRNSSREFFQYLEIASGSLAELEAQLEVSAYDPSRIIRHALPVTHLPSRFLR